MHATSAPGEKTATPLRRILSLCTLDGVAAMPITVLGQSGNSVLAALLTGTFALSTETYGLISSLPFWFNFLQVLLTPLLTQRLDARAATIASAWLGFVAWLALVVALPFIPVGENPVSRAVFLVGISIIALSAAVNGVTWNAWVQQCVPVRLRGKYFGRRNRLLYLSLLTFMLMLSGLLAWFDGSLLAFQILFAGALALRIVSITAEHRMRTPSTGRAAQNEPHWRDQLRVVWKDVTLVRFIVFASFMGFAVSLFGPFYPVFMYEELHLTVARANLFLLVGVLGAALAFPAWGRLLDRFGNIPVMIVALALWQSSNLLWCLLGPQNLWLLVIIQLAGGLFSAGYGIGLFGLLLKLTPSGARTMGMALFVSISSLAAALGPITGGYLLGWAHSRGYRAIDAYHAAFLAMPLLTIPGCFLLRRVAESNSARVTDVVDAMRNVRTVASLFGLTYLVNQVFYRAAERKARPAPPGA